MSRAIAVSTNFLPSLNSLNALEHVDKPFSRYGDSPSSPACLMSMVPMSLRRETWATCAMSLVVLPASASFIARPSFSFRARITLDTCTYGQVKNLKPYFPDFFVFLMTLLRLRYNNIQCHCNTTGKYPNAYSIKTIKQ